jgi:hypothetical protein
LLNGDEKEAQDAIDMIRIPTNSLIMKYPLLIGWTPARNIYTALKNLQSDVNTLKSDVSTLKSDVRTLKVDMADVKRMLEQLLRSKLTYKQFLLHA